MSMDPRPTLIFDGACAFCAIWASVFERTTGTAVEYLTAQATGRLFPVSAEQMAQAIQFVASDGEVASGAHAAIQALAAAGRGRLQRLEQRSHAWSRLFDAGYRFVAANREGFGRLDRLLFGDGSEPALERRRRVLAAIAGRPDLRSGEQPSLMEP
jgi:predicted DCC family thiol-disulfide oxidoreductase YuxK